MRRVFFAVPISTNLLPESGKLITDLSTGFRRAGITFHPTLPQNLHVTLAFLGEVEEERVPALRDVLNLLPVEPSFEIRITDYGAFPSMDAAKVLWLGVEHHPTVSIIRSNLLRALSPHFRVELHEAFIPHVTLGRFPKPMDIKEQIKNLRAPMGIGIIDQVGLYESLRENNFPEYRTIASVPLE